MPQSQPQSQSQCETSLNTSDYPAISYQQAHELIPASMRIGSIWAQTTTGVIGDGDNMPWHLPEDLKHFKESTWGAPVVMGRTSWEALGQWQPLPGRHNYVITRNTTYDAPGATVVPSLLDSIARAAHDHPTAPILWVLGGGQVYSQAMNFVDELVITDIDMTAPPSFRVHAPTPDPQVFHIESGEWLASEKGAPCTGGIGHYPGPLRYRIMRWTRREQG